MKLVCRLWHKYALAVEQTIIPDTTTIYAQHTQNVDTTVISKDLTVYLLKSKDAVPLFRLDLSKDISSEQYNVAISPDRQNVYCITWGGLDVHHWRVPSAYVLPQSCTRLVAVGQWAKSLPSRTRVTHPDLLYLSLTI